MVLIEFSTPNNAFCWRSQELEKRGPIRQSIRQVVVLAVLSSLLGFRIYQVKDKFSGDFVQENYKKEIRETRNNTQTKKSLWLDNILAALMQAADVIGTTCRRGYIDYLI